MHTKTDTGNSGQGSLNHSLTAPQALWMQLQCQQGCRLALTKQRHWHSICSKMDPAAPSAPVTPVCLQLACCLELAVAGLLVVLHTAEEVDVHQHHVTTGGKACQARLQHSTSQKTSGTAFGHSRTHMRQSACAWKCLKGCAVVQQPAPQHNATPEWSTTLRAVPGLGTPAASCCCYEYTMRPVMLMLQVCFITSTAVRDRCHDG